MDKSKLEAILEIIQGAQTVYHTIEGEIKSRAIGGHAAHMGWCADQSNHKEHFYWNYFGGRNKEYRAFTNTDARPLPFLTPQEKNEAYAFIASKSPELVESGVIGHAISVLVQNSWKDNEFKFDLGNTKPSCFGSGIEIKCSIEIKGDVGHDSLRDSKDVHYTLHGSAGKNSVQALQNCTLVAETIKGSIGRLSNCIITAKRIGGDDYSISEAHHSSFKVESLNSGFHGNHCIVDSGEINGDICAKNSVVIIRGNKIPPLKEYKKFYDAIGKNGKLIIFKRNIYNFWHQMIEEEIKDFRTNRHTLALYPLEIVFAEGLEGKGDFGKGLGYIKGEERT